MRHLIVLNSSILENKPDAISKELVDKAFKGLDYEVYCTTAPRSCVDFLKKYLSENKKDTVRVYACGGDGTVQEVATGIADAPNAELAIYACGTGNDFVKIYGGQERFLDFKKLIEGEAKPIDISKIEGGKLRDPWISVNVINFGFDAIVGAMGNYYKDNGYPEKAKKKGMSPYDYALKHDAMKHGRFNDTVVYADKEQLNEKQMLLCTIAQGQYVGGKFKCAPKSDNTDGKMDVCMLKTMTLIGLGMIIGTYTEGKHLDKPRKKVVYRQAKQVRIVAPKDIDICVDGEMTKGKEFTVTCIPGGIKLVMPKE